MINVKDLIRPLIPILKVGRVEGSYALRLTPFDKYGVPEIEKFLKENFEDFIFVQETSKKIRVHYHCIIFTKHDEYTVREIIRAYLKTIFTDPPKRGDANKQYNLSEIDELELALIYILKDGGENFCSSNIDFEVLSDLKKKSYRKYSKQDFTTQLEELKAKFKDEKTRLEDMMVSIVKLKSLYRQPVNMNNIYQMCVSYDVHNNPNDARVYVSDFLSRYK